MKRMTAAGRTAALVLTVLTAASVTSACTSSSSTGSTGAAAGPSGSATQGSPSGVATTSDAGSSAGSGSVPTSSSASPRGGTHAVTAANGACTLAALGHGKWTAVPGSSGAGHTSADIAFQNTSSKPCTVTGFPAIVLRDASGHPLPTHVTHFATSAATVTVAPGAWIHSELRFSPDIPGQGEPTDAQCEPNTVTATVQVPGDSKVATVKLDAPTAVCGQGAIDAKAFAAGEASPDGG